MVIRERPFATVLYPEFQGTHCLTCFGYVEPEAAEGASFPCPGGCRRVRFCSDLCRRLGWEAFHRAECRWLAHLQGDPDQLGAMTPLVHRTLLEAGFERVVRAARADRAEMQGRAVYDSSDYAPVALQVEYMEQFCWQNLGKISEPWSSEILLT